MKSPLAYMPTVTLGTDLSSKKPFTLAGGPLQQHKIVTGITGQGKSKFLAGMAVQLLRERKPLSIVDPHGDLCTDVLATFEKTGYFTDNRAFTNLWYIQFSREDRHIPFNVLQAPYPPDQVASQVLEAWKRAWSGIGDGNAVNLENILLSALMVLVAAKMPVTELSSFLMKDDSYRASLLDKVSDPLIREFFTLRFTGKKTASLGESTLRRAFLLTFSPVLRACLGDSRNMLNFRALMDNRISCLFDLSNLDPQTQRFLGCLLTIGFEQAALSRANMPEEKRTSYHLFLDEFSQYSAQSGQALENILTLTRKFGLSLILACQTLHQTGDIKAALQNCLPITFKMGHEDAHELATRFLDNTTPQTSFFGSLFQTTKPLVTDGQNRTEWTRVIKSLEQQECLIHLGGKTFKLQTLTMPSVDVAAVKRIKERYAQQLLVANKIEAPVAAPAGAATTPAALPISAEAVPVVPVTRTAKRRMRRVEVDE